MLSRRQLFVVFGATAFEAGCRNEAPAPTACADTSGLTAEELQARTALVYADLAADPNKSCTTCQQYVAPAQKDACGGCKLLRGPIHPKGYCKAFAART
jgi:hypothetical protein